MSPIERVLEKLPDARRNGQEWTAKCPAHNDRKPSLSIAEGDDGRALVLCRAGCKTEAVVDALSLTMKDLMPINGQSLCGIKTKPVKQKTYYTVYEAINALERQYGEKSAVWFYHNRDAQMEGAIVRWDKPDGTKDIRPVSWREAERHWVVGGMQEPRILYKMATPPKTQRVYILEGEKCVDAAESIGLRGTTSAHGSKSASKTDWSVLAGKECIILPDCDDAGREYADDATHLLSKLKPAPIIKIVELPGLPDGGDIVDWINDHDSIETEDLKRQVETLADEAEPIEAIEPERVSPAVESYRPYPVNALPTVLQQYVEAVAGAMRTDPACVALAGLTVCATAIGTSRSVQLKRRWREHALLWAVIVAEQGSGKSPPMREAMRPLVEEQRRELDRHALAMQRYEEDLASYQRDIKLRQSGGAIGTPQKPERPICVRHIVSDATLESLGPILQENLHGILQDGDELAGWFGGMDRYAQTRRGDAAAWRRIFDGHSITIDRKTSRQTIHVPWPSINIIGTIQPAILQRALSIEHLESGLAARMILAFPPARPIQWSDRDIPEVVEAAYERLIHKLLELSPDTDEDGHPQPVSIPLAPDARRRFIKWHDAHRSEQAGLTGAMAGHWSKLVAYCARLSLIIQMVRHVSSEATGSQVEDDSVVAAISLIDWHKAEARRVYSMMIETEEDRDQRRLVEAIERKGGSVTPRDIMRSSRLFVNTHDAEVALGELVKKGMGQWE